MKKTPSANSEKEHLRSMTLAELKAFHRREERIKARMDKPPKPKKAQVKPPLKDTSPGRTNHDY